MEQVVGWFYSQVNHDANWDIKRPEPWERTIGTTFPGSFDTPVVFRGRVMTLEQLGNFTYGYIGAAMGIPAEVLLFGSAYAAGLPSIYHDAREHVINEFGDQIWVLRGIIAFDGGRYGG